MFPVDVYGVRHHGPGSARAVRAALEEQPPDLVLIEGCPELDAIVDLAGARPTWCRPSPAWCTPSTSPGRRRSTRSPTSRRSGSPHAGRSLTASPVRFSRPPGDLTPSRWRRRWRRRPSRPRTAMRTSEAVEEPPVPSPSASTRSARSPRRPGTTTPSAGGRTPSSSGTGRRPSASPRSGRRWPRSGPPTSFVPTTIRRCAATPAASSGCAGCCGPRSRRPHEPGSRWCAGPGTRRRSCPPTSLRPAGTPT